MTRQLSSGVPTAREWPEHGLDVDVELARGWRPVPLSQFVLKLVGTCNLACDYCYVYQGADRSWRHRPAVCSPDVLRAAVARISEYAVEHGLTGVDVVLHGGEPLLVGPQDLERTLRTVREGLDPAVDLRLSVQTNGILLTDRMLEVLAAHDVRVGVSLDGGVVDNDRHRTYVDGRGSYAAVARGLHALADERFRHLFAGLLCTVDPRSDPVDVYEALLAFEPPVIDFLLPHRTWSWAPPGLPVSSATDTPYGDWLVSVFDRWFGATRWEVEVRLFDDIVRLLAGKSSRTGQVGLSPVSFVVIDTDGSLQQVDTLKVVAPGAPETGLDVFAHSLNEVGRHPAVVARQIGLAALADTCRACRLVQVCGGGNYTHRYRPGSGFRNPSAYCHDLQVLIDHVVRRLRDEVR